MLLSSLALSQAGMLMATSDSMLRSEGSDTEPTQDHSGSRRFWNHWSVPREASLKNCRFREAVFNGVGGWVGQG